MNDEDLFEHAPCGYAVLDSGQLVVRANAAFLRLVGRPAPEVVGRLRFEQLVPLSARIYLETHLLPALRLHGEFQEVALEVVRPDDERVPVLISANTDGDSTRLVAFEARQRRAFELNLLTATKEAEQARERAAETARILQRTLIPPTPPRVPGLDVAAAYRPAGDGSVVGGDFYDVFQVSPAAWMVVVGDVEGKGTAAATVTAFVRHQVRALAMQHDDPADLLAHLNTVLLDDEARQFCTLVLARLDPADPGWRVRLALGGQPHPLLTDRTGTVREVGEPGTLVGVLPEAEFTTVDVPLTDGSLVLFTDGVTEARGAAGLYGERHLADVVRGACGQDAAGLTSTIVADVLDYQAGRAADDIAVITLAVHPSPARETKVRSPRARPDRPGGKASGEA